MVGSFPRAGRYRSLLLFLGCVFLFAKTGIDVTLPYRLGVVTIPPDWNKDTTNPISFPQQEAPRQRQQNATNNNWANPSQDDLDVDIFDRVLRGGSDNSPIVIRKYKLLFFTIPKNACTPWKQLFRRMRGFKNWRSNKGGLPHNPIINGLVYLNRFKHEKPGLVRRLLTSPKWTRAVFIHDPKERFVSAWLDKVIADGDFFHKVCCVETSNPTECMRNAQTPEGFLDAIHNCSDKHWKPQSKRMEPKYWKYINFVGRFESNYEDAKRLLTKIGAWDRYGAKGWGKYGNESMFEGLTTLSRHTTDASSQLGKYIHSQEIERRIEEYYASDYEMDLFGFSKKKIN